MGWKWKVKLPDYPTTNGDDPFQILLNRWMWIGFALVAIIDLLNGLHFLFPSIPQVFSKRYYLRFTEAPFLAMGNLPFALYPFVIGLGFLIPLDLSFSCWLFLVLETTTSVGQHNWSAGFTGLPLPPLPSYWRLHRRHASSVVCQSSTLAGGL